MKSLKQFGISNFKLFNSLNNFELKPITYLTGTNSSGKSSLNKALLLMHNCMNKELNFKLNTNQGGLNLGDYNNCLNHFSDSEEMIFLFPLEITDNWTEINLRLTFSPTEGDIKLGKIKLIEFIHKSGDVIFELNFDCKKMSPLKLSDIYIDYARVAQKHNMSSFSTFFNPLVSQCSDFIIEDEDLFEIVKLYNKTDLNKDSLNDLFLECKMVKDLIISLAKEEGISTNEYILLESCKLPITINNTYFGTSFNHGFSIDDLFSEFNLKFELSDYGRIPNFYYSNLIYFHKPTFMGKIVSPLDWFAKNFTDELLSSIRSLDVLLKNITYIPINRSKLERSYQLVDEKNYFISSLFDLISKESNSNALKFINDKIKEFEIADSIEINLVNQGANFDVQFVKDGIKTPLIDLGYGVSLLMPILIGIAAKIHEVEGMLDYEGYEWEDDYRYGHSALFIIEEPESNLHPAFQSKLADLFVECSLKYGMNFIVETHSEYIIRKTQYLSKLKPTFDSHYFPLRFTFNPENSIVYYFNKNKGTANGNDKIFNEIKFSNDGVLSNSFGKGFFDEADNIALELFLLKSHQTN
jgi:AAA15 family ATPase/GTPase